MWQSNRTHAAVTLVKQVIALTTVPTSSAIAIRAGLDTIVKVSAYIIILDIVFLNIKENICNEREA